MAKVSVLGLRTFNQCLCFFLLFSVTKGSDSSKLKSNSVGTLKELHAGPEQAQSNQQAFISALQKLADKQAARRYASSSHINLLTQHVSPKSLFLVLELTEGGNTPGGFIFIMKISDLIVIAGKPIFSTS